MTMHSKDLLAKYCSDDYRKEGLQCAAWPLQNIQSMWLLKIQHLMQMGSSMEGCAGPLYCNGLQDGVKISSGAPELWKTSSKASSLSLRGSIHQQQEYQRTGKIWQQTGRQPRTRKR